MEDKRDSELLRARSDADHQSRIFAADLPHGWKQYKVLYPPKDSPEVEFGGPIEEVSPQNERELQQLISEMKRSGAKFAD